MEHSLDMRNILQAIKKRAILSTLSFHVLKIVKKLRLYQWLALPQYFKKNMKQVSIIIKSNCKVILKMIFKSKQYSRIRSLRIILSKLIWVHRLLKGTLDWLRNKVDWILKVQKFHTIFLIICKNKIKI